jgi:hypothetical protein
MERIISFVYKGTDSGKWIFTDKKHSESEGLK